MSGKAMDKLYRFDENGSIVEVLVPTGIGFVGWYAGPEPPEGYLYCDGSAIGRETYSELYDAIGTLYGAGDGSTTFNLPDARGVFFRGTGGNAAAMGTRQGDAIQDLAGQLQIRAVGDVEANKSTVTFTGQNGVFKNMGFFESTYNVLNMGVGGGITGVQLINYQASYVVPTANEVRPINLAMKPCIRYV